MTFSERPPSPPTHFFHADKSPIDNQQDTTTATTTAQRRTSTRWLSGTPNGIFRALGRRSTTTGAAPSPPNNNINSTALTPLHRRPPRHSLQPQPSSPVINNNNNNNNVQRKGRWEKVIFTEQPGSRVLKGNGCQEISSGIEEEIFITKTNTTNTISATRPSGKMGFIFICLLL
ncbi:hypothetical protein BDA99DRAFT_310738 [Phascolomyces articulosus]|uniref:Uncharacterized protein n=1 Tax=Phascolomyces articulosus TaxID=60185 RepID=A0AAD5JL20_9FUNG|nr:hypothetical protein BDA99DRAFT_310738 [Phascolomyces articulosus]